MVCIAIGPLGSGCMADQLSAAVFVMSPCNHSAMTRRVSSIERVCTKSSLKVWRPTLLCFVGQLTTSFETTKYFVLMQASTVAAANQTCCMFSFKSGFALLVTQS